MYNVRLPGDKLAYIAVAKAYSRADIGIDDAGRQGADIVDCPLAVTAHAVGQSENTDIVTFFPQLAAEIAHGGGYTVCVGAKQVACNKYLRIDLPLLLGFAGVL